MYTSPWRLCRCRRSLLCRPPARPAIGKSLEKARRERFWPGARRPNAENAGKSVERGKHAEHVEGRWNVNHDGAYDSRSRLELHFGRPNFLTGEDDGNPIVMRGFNLVQESRA